MNKFKVGDKVRRIADEFAGMKIGDISTVSEIMHNTGVKLKEFETKENVTHATFSLELVKENKKQMEKRFKNKISVKGSKSLLKAFAEELNVLGYAQLISGSITQYPLEVILINSDTSGEGYYLHQASHLKQNYDYNLTLPEDWNEALKLAAEEKIVIPEYVEVLSGFFVENEVVGKIYKTSEPFPKHLQYCNEYIWETIFNNPDNAVHFKPSTKEVFDKQNEPQYKVGDWVTHTACWGSPYDGLKTYRVKKIKDNNLYPYWAACQTACGYINNFRLATEEEIKEATKPKELIINSYKVKKVNEEQVKVGCKTFDEDSLKELKNFLEYYGGHYEDGEGVPWDSNEIAEVINVFKE